MSDFSFRTSHDSGSARLGWFSTPHGVVETPAFMPVGTHGTIKGLSVEEVAAAGGQMILSNAYHLYLRPGDMMVRALGGLHAFTRWDGPMLTDSGGFQVFSLSGLRKVSEEGVVFQSHIDGSKHNYTPESVMRIERNIGADVIMQLDELIAGQAEYAASQAAMERSLRWLDRCRVEFDRISREGRGAPPSSKFRPAPPPWQPTTLPPTSFRRASPSSPSFRAASTPPSASPPPAASWTAATGTASPSEASPSVNRSPTCTPRSRSSTRSSPAPSLAT
jgi:queuine tRNA-ribosyltransferase